MNPHPQYFPSFSLRGKSVLDVGAGCGESCREYLEAGATNVTCIENDPKRYIYLMRNYGDKDRVRIITEPFSPRMLDGGLNAFDFMKMNIGGYEVSLFWTAPKLPPSNILAHSQWHVDELAKHGFRKIPNCGGQPYNGYAWMTNES